MAGLGKRPPGARAHVVADQSEVAAYLASPETHGGAPVEQIDTHAAMVFLAGDFYIKAVPVANDFVIRRLNERGLQVVVEPIAVIMEYLAEERLSDLFGLPSKWLS